MEKHMSLLTVVQGRLGWQCMDIIMINVEKAGSGGV